MSSLVSTGCVVRDTNRQTRLIWTVPRQRREKIDPSDISVTLTKYDQEAQCIDWLDRIAIGYLVLPVSIFFVGWCKPWAAAVLICAVAWLVSPLFRHKVRSSHLGIPLGTAALCITVAAVWAYIGGIGHFRYTNSDWLIRDAVLRDLVVSPWPVGYGEYQGQETLLRTTVAYFLPAAALGKLFGLQATQTLLFLWTAVGAGLFLMQVSTLTPQGKTAIVTTLLVVTLFSGMDIVGNLLNWDGYFISTWHIDNHLEWWAEDYQYSSITTQLFWVPNHALGGWLYTGLLLRNKRETYELLPVTLVSLLLWSPLALIGVLPFALWRYFGSLRTDGCLGGISLAAWLGAILVLVPLVVYVSVDLEGYKKGIISLGSTAVARELQFFFLEVGIVGLITYVLRPSAALVIALLVLLFLPVGYFGAGNDLVMRSSIPSLAVLVVTVCSALAAPVESDRARLLKVLLIVILCIGAVTPMEEIARSFVQPRWDARSDVTLVGASCGQYWHHYIAKLDHSAVRYFLREPTALPLGPKRSEWCGGP